MCWWLFRTLPKARYGPEVEALAALDKNIGQGGFVSAVVV
jgi:hypothetical protein